MGTNITKPPNKKSFKGVGHTARPEPLKVLKSTARSWG